MFRIDANRLQKVFARLGDAVIDPAIWPDIIEEICAAAGATGGALLQSDVRTLDVPRATAVEELTKAYFADGWHMADIRAERGIPLTLAGQKVVTDQDIVTPEEIRQLSYYNELLAPHGFGWFAAVSFKAGTAPWVLSIHRTRGQGPFEADEKPALAQLSQRLMEVASLSTAVGRVALSSAANALNAMRQPAVALDRLGFVLEANRGAEALFDADIRIKDRRLAVRDAGAKRDIDKLVDRLTATSDMTTLPCDPIIVGRREKRPVILRVLPVHGAARTPFLGARVLLTLTPMEPRPAPNTAMLGRAFGLTPAEARLASIIARGLSPEQAAEELGVSRVTVRNQLRVIFSKTDTHRQSELVALLSRL